jgi:dienelactone hydrolase
MKQYSIEDFFKNPEIVDIQISPDGKYYSYLTPHERVMNIAIKEISTGIETLLTSFTDDDVEEYFWKGNDYVVFLKDKDGSEDSVMYSINLQSKEIRTHTNFDKVKTIIVDTLHYVNDNKVIIGLNKRNPEIFDLYEYDFKQELLTLIFTNDLKLNGDNPHAIDWLFDHNGKLRIITVSDDIERIYYYRAADAKLFKQFLHINFDESFVPLFFDYDNAFIYCLSNIGRDKVAAIKYDPITKKEIEILYEDEEYDVGAICYSEKEKSPTSIYWYGCKEEHKILSSKIQKIYDTFVREINGKIGYDYEFSIVDHCDEEVLYIVTASCDIDPGTYYLYDANADKITKIADVMPWITPTDMASTTPIKYKTNDGITEHGYLTLPKNINGKIPLIVNPHGGPWHRDTWGFDPELQFLANRGYAVLQMNFRGSTGYGREFWKKSFKQWGLLMQDDIRDAVYAALKQGIFDEKKIAIYGGSYGGYATLMGLIKTPDLYCCGIDYVGVSNLFTFMETIPPYWKAEIKEMYAMVGDPKEDEEQFKQTSPVFNVDKIKVPVMIAQGQNDPRVNVNESEQMVKALKEKGIKVLYMLKEDEGHGFTKESNSIEFYTALEQFLNKNIK